VEVPERENALGCWNRGKSKKSTERRRRGTEEERMLEKRGFVPGDESPSKKKGSGDADKREWIQIRQMYDKGEFDFSVSVPMHMVAAAANARA
jgi:hypothetical protein